MTGKRLLFIAGLCMFLLWGIVITVRWDSAVWKWAVACDAESSATGDERPCEDPRPVP